MKTNKEILPRHPYFSKVHESFTGDWLIPIVKPYFDPDQFGLKGLSITHYPIKLLDFVLIIHVTSYEMANIAIPCCNLSLLNLIN